MKRDDGLALGLLALVLAALAFAAISPYDRRVFLLEVVPWVVLLGLVVATHRRFPLTPLSHIAIALLCLLLVLGAHYTYSRVPAGLWVRDALDLSRNPYDRLVHFIGGAVGGLLIREQLLRRTRLVRGARTFLIVSQEVSGADARGRNSAAYRLSCGPGHAADDRSSERQSGGQPAD